MKMLVKLPEGHPLKPAAGIFNGVILGLAIWAAILAVGLWCALG